MNSDQGLNHTMDVARAGGKRTITPHHVNDEKESKKARLPNFHDKLARARELAVSSQRERSALQLELRSVNNELEHQREATAAKIDASNAIIQQQESLLLEQAFLVGKLRAEIDSHHVDYVEKDVQLESNLVGVLKTFNKWCA